MNREEEIEIKKSREYIVAKSNTIVQKSRYDFSVAEQRTIAYICSKIKPLTVLDKAKHVPYQLEYEFKILDYTRTCGLEDNGKLYEDVKATLKSLSDKSMWLQQEDGSEVLVRWLAKARTNKKSGKVTIKLDEDMVPYLFDLKEKFLSYGLKNILNMKSQYSIRLYELLKSIQGQKNGFDHRDKLTKSKDPYTAEWIVDVDQLKKTLMVDSIKSYKDFGVFRQKVLEPAMKEINLLTDINVEYEPITKGRKVIKIQFKIVDKLFDEKCDAEWLNDDLLNGEEI